ncbi:MAG: NADH:ubiquinone reductase (Na(+)-transporting) subunit F [Bacteroidales bacterium]|jgi:Na+-transporting NADH:ubiquinone oxidoreductase subunit F|nr:NADH:ubiquinone reductase (Na(+)-transporting) subunit F [Bacteroidales bacterium]
MGVCALILISTAVFLTVLLLLVAILLFLRRKLLPSHKVKVVVNDENVLETNSGDSLLTILSNNAVFLSSACGGKATCGLCKCQIVQGGEEMLPTEEVFFKKKEKNEGMRLACQVKVKDDIKIVVPESVFNAKKYEAAVLSNENIATFIKELVIQLPQDVDFQFQAGQFIQIYSPAGNIDFVQIEISQAYSSAWEKLRCLKMECDEENVRAYSMANYPAEGKIVKLNVRIAMPPFDTKNTQFVDVNPGIVSSYLFSRKKGDKIEISGPYGEFLVKNTEKEMIFIGGGAGMAPLRSQIFDEIFTKKTKRKISYYYGARSLKEAFYLDDFAKLQKKNANFSFELALSEPLPEDNWKGKTGFIHIVLLENYLKDHPEPEEIEYYICGPKPMLNATLHMLENLGVAENMIFYDDFGS